jgi:hypothetical protein
LKLIEDDEEREAFQECMYAMANMIKAAVSGSEVEVAAAKRRSEAARTRMELLIDMSREDA